MQRMVGLSLEDCISSMVVWLLRMVSAVLRRDSKNGKRWKAQERWSKL